VNMPRLFFGQADLLGSTMGNAGEFEQVLEAIGRGLRPIVDSTFALDEATRALERLERAEQFGKVVLHP
jgi:D-arabinose 1-dehydrogenase-like Zn-dependent alcohol dehydrogenase